MNVCVRARGRIIRLPLFSDQSFHYFFVISAPIGDPMGLIEAHGHPGSGCRNSGTSHWLICWKFEFPHPLRNSSIKISYQPPPSKTQLPPPYLLAPCPTRSRILTLTSSNVLMTILESSGVFTGSTSIVLISLKTRHRKKTTLNYSCLALSFCDWLVSAA